MDRHVKDTWTVFKIMGEFVEGFETLRPLWPAVSVFGGARMKRNHPWYRASVTSSLYSYWKRPILSGNLTTLEVTVEFEILRDGAVGKLQITTSSGVPSLDRSVLRAVADASPLPPLPAQWEDSTLPARFIFKLHSLIFIENY